MSIHEPGRGRIHRYPGERVTVLYELKRCIHAGACVRGLPDVFRPRETPWVEPGAAGEAELLATVLSCPTGALRAERADGSPVEPVPAENVIELCPDGPLYARGDLEIVSGSIVGGPSASGHAASGEGATEGPTVLWTDTRVALCRCGASANKPFCDGSHAEVEFFEPGLPEAVALRDDPALADSPRLRIHLRPNGPLVLEGPVRILAADRSVCASGTRGALCRCGRSAKKPLCDGSHKQGFVAE